MNEKNKDVRRSREVYVTTDYDGFNTLCGNRGVDLQRVTKIKTSIEKAYIPSPIVVNEKMEVIDGQGRLQALRELKLPVYYIVVQGANLDDCIRMNITSTPWDVRDYIYSGRDRGNKDYIKLASLVDRYTIRNKNGNIKNVDGHKASFLVPLNIILGSAEGTASAGSFRGTGSSNKLKRGLFKVKREMEAIIDECDYVSSLHGIAPCFSIAAKILLFVKRNPDIDEIRMRNQIVAYQRNREKFPAYNTVDECILSFEALYNYRLSDKIDFRSMYRKYVENFMPKNFL